MGGQPTQPFDFVQYNRMLASGRRYIMMVYAGTDAEVRPDEWKRELRLVACSSVPEVMMHHYVAIDDLEIKELLHGPHGYILYSEMGP